MNQPGPSGLGERRSSLGSTKRQSNAELLLYWVPTAIVVLNGAGGGLFDAIRAREALEVFRHLGYPDYFATLLGIAKVLGAFALVAPIPRTVREWAYAGLTFDVIAAVISIIAVGDPITNITVPTLFLALTLTSYAMWRRRAGQR